MRYINQGPKGWREVMACVGKAVLQVFGQAAGLGGPKMRSIRHNKANGFGV